MLQFKVYFSFKVVPHITDAIQEWVERVAQKPVSSDGTKQPEICIIEVGKSLVSCLHNVCLKFITSFICR